MSDKMDTIFLMILKEAATRDELGTELNILMICLEVLERYRTLADGPLDEIAGRIHLTSFEAKQ